MENEIFLDEHESIKEIVERIKKWMWDKLNQFDYRAYIYIHQSKGKSRWEGYKSLCETSLWFEAREIRYHYDLLLGKQLPSIEKCSLHHSAYLWNHLFTKHCNFVTNHKKGTYKPEEIKMKRFF